MQSLFYCYVLVRKLFIPVESSIPYCLSFICWVSALYLYKHDQKAVTLKIKAKKNPTLEKLEQLQTCHLWWPNYNEVKLKFRKVTSALSRRNTVKDWKRCVCICIKFLYGLTFQRFSVCCNFRLCHPYCIHTLKNKDFTDK